jgi:hypothetical protein
VKENKKRVCFIINHLPSTLEAPHCGERSPLSNHHSQTEPTKQTTLHNMLDSDDSVHLETKGQTFIYLLQSISDTAPGMLVEFGVEITSTRM